MRRSTCMPPPSPFPLPSKGTFPVSPLGRETLRKHLFRDKLCRMEFCECIRRSCQCSSNCKGPVSVFTCTIPTSPIISTGWMYVSTSTLCTYNSMQASCIRTTDDGESNTYGSLSGNLCILLPSLVRQETTTSTNQTQDKVQRCLAWETTGSDSWAWTPCVG